ncbi:putative polysaccharide biosynthesis protein [Niallia circulans]|uniref:putative polysaccharide biosynthesis protein n=1 Tax=Niallia circulans TaxID=1397 RepID=UPI001F33321C|nr:polysaccharide biosynthesis protein [Niallia circulans]
MPKQSNNWFTGAIILTVGALVVKILSAVYRIPFQNIVGDTGFYIYQQVYPIYGVAIALSTYGFPVVISKLYTEMKSKEDQIGIERLISSSFILLYSLGICAFLILFFGAEFLSSAMGDRDLSILIKVISFAFLFTPFIATSRGIIQGTGNMIPTAVSQVAEQLMRVGTILFCSIYFISKGYSLYKVGAGAMLGSVTGGMLAFIVLFYFYRKQSVRTVIHARIRNRDNKKIIKRIIYEGITISISSMLLILLQLADSLTIYSELITAGAHKDEAKVLKGIYDRGQPLIQLGTVISTSMALTLVPFITGEMLKKKKGLLVEKVRFSLVVSLFFGFGASIGLFSMINKVNSMLFQNEQGSHVLAILCFVILLNAMIVTYTAVLQGLGATLYPAVIVLLGFIFKYAINGPFVAAYGTSGAAYATNLSLALILVFLAVRLYMLLKLPLINQKQVTVILLAAFCMYLTVKGYIYLTDNLALKDGSRLLSAFQSLSGVALGGFVYVFLVLRGNVFKEKDLLTLPFGSKLSWFLPKKGR